MDITVIELGLGEVVCNYGAYEGRPAVFLEPVKTLGIATGQPGQSAPDTSKDAVAPRTVILRIHNASGAYVVMEDLVSAMNFIDGENRNIQSKSHHRGTGRDGMSAVESWIDSIVLAVMELPNRNSPEDQPEMMLVTDAELRSILEDKCIEINLRIE